MQVVFTQTLKQAVSSSDDLRYGLLMLVVMPVFLLIQLAIIHGGALFFGGDFTAAISWLTTESGGQASGLSN